MAMHGSFRSEDHVPKTKQGVLFLFHFPCEFEGEYPLTISGTPAYSHGSCDWMDPMDHDA